MISGYYGYTTIFAGANNVAVVVNKIPTKKQVRIAAAGKL
jgi:hypothetical protein